MYPKLEFSIGCHYTEVFEGFKIEVFKAEGYYYGEAVSKKVKIAKKQDTNLRICVAKIRYAIVKYLASTSKTPCLLVQADAPQYIHLNLAARSYFDRDTDSVLTPKVIPVGGIKTLLGSDPLFAIHTPDGKTFRYAREIYTLAPGSEVHLLRLL